MSGISRSQVSRLCEEIDGQSEGLPGTTDRRRLAVSLDRCDLPESAPRQDALSLYLPSAIAGNRHRHQRAAGAKYWVWRVGTSEAEPIWTEFLRKVDAPRPCCPNRGVSDAHEGIKAATSPRCYAQHGSAAACHFMRNGTRPYRKERAACRLCLHRHRLRPGDGRGCQRPMARCRAQTRYAPKCPSSPPSWTRPDPDVPGLHDLPKGASRQVAQHQSRSSVSMVRSSGAPMWSASSTMRGSHHPPRRGPAARTE